jgi:hypothetical protein
MKKFLKGTFELIIFIIFVVLEMFYDSNQIDNELLCKNCEGRLHEPKILPCGEIICSLCERCIQVNDRIFDCIACKQKHEMPKNGLIICKPLLKLLSIMPANVSRGESYDLLEKLLNEMQKKTSFIKLGIENSNDLIKEYCIELRNDVQLTAEKAILQVNELNNKIIEEIDEYEKELIEFNKTNKESLDAFNKIVKEMESFHAINTEYLKKNKVDYEIINKANEEATNFIKKAELEIENLKDIIFDGQIFMFEKNNEKISKSILGVSKIFDKKNSTILLEKYQTEQLMSLCEFPVRQKWDLIYRASQDGFEASSFHSKCDNRPNTLVIVKSTNGNVFGGYTEQTWNHANNYKADPNAFIFSLINKLNKPIKMKWSKSVGICCRRSYGPTFGGGHDFYIAGKSNLNATSYSNLGYSYVHPDYANGSDEAKSFLAGSYNFQVSEIEVYIKQ